MIIGDIIFRFFVFWFKIIFCCVFVLALQVRVGQKSLEQWIESGLKNSSLNKYLQKTTTEGAEVFSEKFPILRGLAQNKIVRNNSIMELHSGLLQQLDNAMDGIDFEDVHTRLPATEENTEKKLQNAQKNSQKPPKKSNKLSSPYDSPPKFRSYIFNHSPTAQKKNGKNSNK